MRERVRERSREEASASCRQHAKSARTRLRFDLVFLAGGYGGDKKRGGRVKGWGGGVGERVDWSKERGGGGTGPREGLLRNDIIRQAECSSS